MKEDLIEDILFLKMINIENNLLLFIRPTYKSRQKASDRHFASVVWLKRLIESALNKTHYFFNILQVLHFIIKEI